MPCACMVDMSSVAYMHAGCRMHAYNTRLEIIGVRCALIFFYLHTTTLRNSPSGISSLGSS